MEYNGTERRAHPNACLRQEDWGEIKAFVKETREYRKSLCKKLDNILQEVEGAHKRISALENWRWFVTGGLALITVILVPIATTYLGR